MALRRWALLVCRRRPTPTALLVALGVAVLLALLPLRPSSRSWRITSGEMREERPGEEPIRRGSPVGLGSDWPRNTTQQTRVTSPPVVFIKTTKTGAGTVQNLLFRLGEREGATFAFPRDSFTFRYPHKFRADFVEELPEGSSQFDLLVSPLRLHLPALRQVMPPDAVYVTVIRDPVATFESVFSTHASEVPAFRLARAAAAATVAATAPPTTPLELFLETPERFWDPGRPGNGLARNPMSFDLGLDSAAGAAGGNSSAWEADLAALEAGLRLVLIAEHLDESLVLLGALLGLEGEELASVRLNARTLSHVTPLGPRARRRARAWNTADALLYDRFLRRLWEQAGRYGAERLRGEVALLRASTERVRRQCVARGGVAPGGLEELLRPRQSPGATVLGYQLRADLSQQELGFCVRLVLPERQYHAHLYFQQYGRDLRPSSTSNPTPNSTRRSTGGT
ncbi:galactose-3-O-sulfotransferase 2 [Gadus morhua]|uniref:Galactose-3-O-sulfotransferase 2-like n=1 Tax=Gadus morhua TaxID=8049 RepID=A0A8C5FKJ0_GADMO|nr:galactose-3-O-sulfotransferase 2-like [Gadus morhua]